MAREQTLFGNIFNSHVLYVSHVAEHGEYHKAWKYASNCVHHGEDNHITIWVVVELVIAAKCNECRDSDAVRIKNLSAGIWPNLTE